jgi:hypothetical protein
MTTGKNWILHAVTLAAIAAGLLLAPAAGARQQAGEQPRPAASAKVKPAIDPKADEMLRRMSDYLAGLKSFSFAAEHATEVVLKSGEKLEFLADSTVTVQRPNMLRSDRKGEMADVSFIYDGKAMTIYGRRMNMYASADAPPTLDAAIDFARERLNLEAPAADLLYSNPYKVLMEDVVSGTYVADATVDGVKTHHLAFRGNETDWQIWIEDGPRPLPRRFVIVSKKVASDPEFAVELREWNLEPRVTPDMFSFKPPAGAERIDFVSAGKTARPAR